jgi:TonB-linked SusC/RagA family outer membrane protein
VAVLAILGGLASPAAAQQGNITGQAVDQATGQPLPDVQVVVVGTSRGALANAEGRFFIPNVGAGPQQIRATRIGYASLTAEVEVPADGTVSHTFRLAQSAVELGAIVVSATGQQQSIREIGSSVGVVSVDDVELAPVTTFSELIQGRTPGTLVTASSGNTGAGSRIRIRGSNSLSLSNAPLLVIDGVRVESDPSTISFGSGGQQPSALDDLNPENIESVEILKGPAASALYGTAAANGVIQITTRRGRPGDAQMRVWTEFADLAVGTDFPDNVQSVAGNQLCPLFSQAAGACSPSETFRFNPLENEETTVFDGGQRVVYGASVSGGSDEATYFVSAERSDEESVYDRANFMERTNLQANVTGILNEDLRVRANVGYVDSDAEFPQSDNALFGALPMGLYGSPTPSSVESSQGYESPIAFHRSWEVFQESQRLTSSAGLDWTPLDWLSFNASAGLEDITRHDENRVPLGSAYGRAFGGIWEGFIQITENSVRNLNTNASGSAVLNLTPDLVSTSTLGTQYIREDFTQIYAFGSGLVPGIDESLAGATSDFDTDEANILNATVGAYAQQQFAWKGKLYLNTAVRGDKNTAFGTDIGWIWYPSVSGSWVLSEEEFFPTGDLVNEFRLRAAYGQAGLRPGATDALLSFEGGTGAFQNLNVPAITINELGNAELEPERSTEWEVGFESSLLAGRVGVEATYYSKTSTDALVERDLPPSTGGSEGRWENLGEVRNRGLEFLVSGEAVRSDRVRWNVGLSGSFNDNELVEMGEDAEGNPLPPIRFNISSTQGHFEGYPLGGWWDIPVSFEDQNGDGLLSPSEVTLGIRNEAGELVSDSLAFFGDGLPTREISLNTDVTLFDQLRIAALFDYKGGHKMTNFTRANRCADRINCEAAFNAEASSLEEQAAIIGLRFGGSYAGFIEDADFVKLRELAVTYFVPEGVGNFMGADNLRLTLAGRNLLTWTDYDGLDPEVAFQGASNFLAGDAGTLPPNRILTIRFDASF